MANVGHRAFATLQIELYRVVDYDSKWSTKFHKDCMLDNFFFSFKASFDNVFLIFKIVLGPMSGTELLQHSKLNCTVWWTMISSGLPNFIRIVCLIYFIISLLRRVLIIFLIFKIV